MKRWYAVLMIVGLLFSLCACTQEEGSAQSPPSVQSAQQQQEQQTADTETTQQEQQTADTAGFAGHEKMPVNQGLIVTSNYFVAENGVT